MPEKIEKILMLIIYFVIGAVFNLTIGFTALLFPLIYVIVPTLTGFAIATIVKSLLSREKKSEDL